jgi:hypothetical protein
MAGFRMFEPACQSAYRRPGGTASTTGSGAGSWRWMSKPCLGRGRPRRRRPPCSCHPCRRTGPKAPAGRVRRQCLQTGRRARAHIACTIRQSSLLAPAQHRTPCQLTGGEKGGRDQPQAGRADALQRVQASLVATLRFARADPRSAIGPRPPGACLAPKAGWIWCL